MVCYGTVLEALTFTPGVAFPDVSCGNLGVLFNTLQIARCLNAASK